MTLEERIHHHVSARHVRAIKSDLLKRVEQIRQAAHKAAMEGQPPRRRPPRRPLVERV
jgi:hypothetical protein